ncbi:MAG: rRNA maturation RNase YbeY [Anaerolineae bacterium]|nr:rRNA maturation RNase YbeY [Phycisphaerae bacterium]
MNAKTAKPFAAPIARQLRRAHRQLNPRLNELSVAFVGDERMRALHNQYTGLDSATDVLTFELDHDTRGKVLAGEVVVCVPEARRQAKLRGTRAQDEVLLYALHGMLHLCGFDDRTAAGFKRMHAMEDRILTQIGVGKVFDRTTNARQPAKPRTRRNST